MADVGTKFAEGEVVTSTEAMEAAAQAAGAAKAKADELLESEAAGVLKDKAAVAAKGAADWLETEDAAKIKKKAADLAARVVGDEVVANASDQISKMKDVIGSQWSAQSLEALSQTEIPDEVKQNVLAKTGQVWDELCQDDKTRALAATLVQNLSAAGQNEKVTQLRTHLMTAIESGESVTAVLDQTQGYLTEIYNNPDTQELLASGSEVWQNVESNEKFWSLLQKGRGLLTNIKVKEGQSLLDAPELAALREEGKELWQDLSQDASTQAFLEKAQCVLSQLWAQALTDLGIVGDIGTIVEKGAEIWESIDRQVLSSAMATMLKGALGLVLEYIPNLSLPDIYGTCQSPVGDLTYMVGNLQFSSFDFAPDSLQIKLGNPLSLQVQDIGASVENFVWQYAKPSFPPVLGEGSASLSVKDTSVRLEYAFDYEDGHCTLTIVKHSIELKSFDIKVSDSGQAWLYNMMLGILNTKLREMLNVQLLELAVSKLTQLSRMLNDLSHGFLEIKLDKSLQRRIAESKGDDSQHAAETLTRCFLSEHNKTPTKVTAGNAGIFFSSLPTLPKALFFGPPPAFLAKLHKQLNTSLVIGTVAAAESELYRRYGLTAADAAPKLKVVGKKRRLIIEYSGDMSASAVTAWLQRFCVGPKLITPIDGSTCDFFLSHVAEATPAAIFIGSAPPYAKQAAEKFPAVIFGEFEAASVAAGGAARFAQADGTYPQLIVIPNVSKPAEFIVYNGPDEACAVLDFLAAFVVDLEGMTRISSSNMDNFLGKAPQMPKILLFSSHLGVPKLLKELHTAYGSTVGFGVVPQDVYTAEPALAEKFNVLGAPALLFLKHCGAEPQKYGAKLTEAGVKEAVKEWAGVQTIQEQMASMAGQSK